METSSILSVSFVTLCFKSLNLFQIHLCIIEDGFWRKVEHIIRVVGGGVIDAASPP